MSTEEIEIEQSQKQLERALNMAKMGEDKDLAAKVRDNGERIVRLLYGLLKMTELHVIENKAFEQPIRDFIQVGTELSDLLGTIHLVTVEDQVFVNDIRIRFGRAQNASSLSEELAHHLVGGISFHAMPDEHQLRRIVQLLAGPVIDDPPRASLINQFADEGFDFIDLLGVYRFRISGEGSGPIKKDAKKVTARAAQLVDESWDNLSANRMPNPLPLRRAVTDILEHSGDDVMGLTSARGTNSTFGTHCIQVCRLSLLIARAAKLSEEAVQDLGVSAMFHDMGYSAREGADPENGIEGFPPPYERHAAAGARILLKQRGFHQAKINRALATLMHHWDYKHPNGKPAIYARILRIAEDFANLTRRKGGGLNPHHALASMASGSGKRYDPHLLQLFINTLGKYPPGTLLEVEIMLKNKPMIFILCSQSLTRGPESFDKPICQLIRLHDGRDAPAALKKRPIDLLNKGKVLKVVNDW